MKFNYMCVSVLINSTAIPSATERPPSQLTTRTLDTMVDMTDHSEEEAINNHEKGQNGDVKMTEMKESGQAERRNA